MTIDDRSRLLELLKRHGWNATSFQLLDPDFDYSFLDDDACVAYVDTGGAWVVAGGPIAAEDRLGTVALQFVEEARKARRRVAFFGVERRFLEAIGMRSTPIGEQPWWDPIGWKPRRSLREQFRRARAKGVTIGRAASAELEPGSPLCSDVVRLIRRWLDSRPMPPMAFLVDLNPFRFAEERRFYVARGGAGGKLLGVLVAAPVYLREGWFIEDILRDPAAPNGTAESLIDFAMRDIADSGSTFVTLGLAPLSGARGWLRVARRLMSGFYNFEGLRAFKAKLRPDGWDPIFLAYPRHGSAFVALYDVLAAFAKGSVIRFAVRALLRAPSIILRMLATLLLPWIVILCAASPRWFPSDAVRIAWIAFDVAIAIALFSLADRWRRRVALLVLGGVAVDAVLTAIEAVTFNIPRARGLRDAVVIGVSIAAPIVAGAVLAGGLRRRAAEGGARSPKPEVRRRGGFRP